MLIFTERQLRRVITEYVCWYTDSRPHQGIGISPPDRSPPQPGGSICSRPVLFGLYREFYREAA